MFQYVIRSLLVLLLARYSLCERRIVQGENINKSYVVYILWDLSDEKLTEFYDTTTICGGFLIRNNLVITAAACLKIMPIQYVIAGYNLYVPGAVGRNKKEEECLELAKKPIIEKCYNTANEMYFSLRWFYNDVALARTETAYDFNDEAFTKKCSYKPSAANYILKKLEPGTDVIVYGWGSSHYQKSENMWFDINEKHLKAITTKVITVQDCDEGYKHVAPNTKNLRFCTEGESSLDILGHLKDSRRAITSITQSETIYALDVPGLSGNKTIVLKKRLLKSVRRQGPCQNDHGGPIATWENGEEVVVGVITGYLVNKDMECVSPYIYSWLSNYKGHIETVLKRFGLIET